MGNPNHDPQTGEFTDGASGGAKTGDSTTDAVIKSPPKVLTKKEARMERLLEQARRDMAMRKRFTNGRSGA